MKRKKSHSMLISISFKHFIFLFSFFCIIFSTIIIGNHKSEINPYVACIIAIFSLFGLLLLICILPKDTYKTKENKFIKKEHTEDNHHYRFTREDGDGYVIFDSNGYIIDAKGFGSLMWSSMNIDKELIGKHVNELAMMLQKHGANREIYTNFEIQVHIELLKELMEN